MFCSPQIAIRACVASTLQPTAITHVLRKSIIQDHMIWSTTNQKVNAHWSGQFTLQSGLALSWIEKWIGSDPDQV